VFGLVAAAGTDLSSIKTQLKAQLASFEYEYSEVKLSQLIGGLCLTDTTGNPEDERILTLMDGGDKIRSAAASGDGVICLAVTAIRALRTELESKRKASPGSIAFVLDSLKNPDEIDTLRSAYGNNFYVVSVYSKEKDRKARLASKIASSCTSTVRKEHRDRAERVIAEDLKRDNSGLTQNVEETFPKADFFVSTGEGSSKQIKRFIELVFGEPFITPTLPEYAMFVAKASALRSCDLSRQVGAVIVDAQGALVSSGCNDVPYPQGGMFYEGRKGEDNRDYVVKADPNFSEIANVFAEIVEAFRNAQLFDPEVMSLEDDEIVRRLLHGEWREFMIDARVRNLIEFGRVVHAEMHALSEAARFGRSVAGASLYCTTFPCHICARHIISSGIAKVIFIEPYPKSLTKKLYEREISTDEKRGELPNAVEFVPFEGVAPPFYQRAFAFRPRKGKTGEIIELKRETAIPIGASYVVSNPQIEENLSSKVDEIRVKIHGEAPKKMGAGVSHAKRRPAAPSAARRGTNQSALKRSSAKPKSGD
jgi:cytidine deaminase